VNLRPPGTDGQWHRVHPLTPLISSWQALVVILIFVGQGFGQDALQGHDVPSDVPPNFRGYVTTWLLAGGAVVLALFVLGGGLAVLSWRMTRFRVTEEALEIRHGVIVRSQRRARLDRLQAVDVVQPFIARLVGLARLTLEVAGGADSKITLSYLTESQANSLRNHLLARAAGLRYETVEAPEAPEHQVLQVPLNRLIASLVLSPGAVVTGFAIVALGAAIAATGRIGLVTGLLPVVFGSVGLLWRQFSGGFGFRLATSPDGLRLRHGLLEQRAQTVPPGRVQAIGLDQPWMWRKPDWWSVRVNVAGYGGSRDNSHSTESVLLPVGTREDAIRVFALVAPDLGLPSGEDPHKLVDAGLSGSGGDAGFTASPERARWLDPVVWRRTGFRATQQVLLARSGRLHRRLDVVPHARTQSCGLSQGLLQRRLRLVTFALHSTPGPITPQVRHLDASVGARLLDEQCERARRARVTAGPERWMESPVERPTDRPVDQPMERPMERSGPASPPPG
jgi:putative membrane protein